METFEGGTAVVTGAASGIGRALADRFAAEGMRVAIADVEQGALDTARDELEANGAEVLAAIVDVADRAAVDAFASSVIERFGPPTVLCNNAGVAGAGMGPVWTTTDNDWRWVLGVNLMGVVHGVQAFVPAMVEAAVPAHVVNTSSIYGLASQGPAIYGVSKHAVTRFTEALANDLHAAGSPVGASVLCPGLIATRIVTSMRNRPAALRNENDSLAAAASAAGRGGGVGARGAEEFMKAAEQRFMENGMPPAEVAEIVVDAIKNDRFYILTHPDLLSIVEPRFDAIRDGQNPPGRQP